MTEQGLRRSPRRRGVVRSQLPLPVEVVSSSSSLSPVRLLATKSSSNAVVTPSPAKKKKTTTKRKRSPSPSKLATTDAAAGNAIITYDQIIEAAGDQPFVDLKVPPEELRPSATLTNGQCFHWKAVVASNPPLEQQQQSAWGTHNATMWIGTLRIVVQEQLKEPCSVVVAIQETPTTTLYRPLTPIPNDVNLSEYLRQYFQLEHSLTSLYQEWSAADERLSVIAKHIPGVRIIDQDPWECLISFICSSNNNIPRITKMLSSIRKEYGQPLAKIGDETFYSFPSLNELASKATDQDLRQVCGLGYRSKYILETIQLLKDRGGEEYLHQLQQQQEEDVVQEKLCEFCGVGRKVADCVALFSLRQSNAIPVDTHVWNIACRDYDATLETAKSLTPTVYKRVGDLFRDKFPQKAGWAHSLLFVAELPSCRPVLPVKLVEEMDQYRQVEQAKKKEAKKKSKSKTKTED